MFREGLRFTLTRAAPESSPSFTGSSGGDRRFSRPRVGSGRAPGPGRRLDLWQQSFTTEQCRLARLLIERAVIADGWL